MTIIAIDGPSGSGKSTIARTIAERLNLPYLDTGAMYRAIGMVALRRNVDFWNEALLTKIAAETTLQMLDERVDGKLIPRIIVMGADATADIRTAEVSQAASAVAIHPGVRDRLVSRQRNWVHNRGGGVVEGRDIGTVVFPDADLKVFLTAADSERVRRRQTDPHAPEFAKMNADEAAAELAERDHRDSTRSASPMKAADDAFVVDTSDHEIEDVVIEIFSELRRRNDGELPMGSG